jgi:hypothetical protein
MRTCRETNPAGADIVETSSVRSVIEDCLIEHLGTSAVVISDQHGIHIGARSRGTFGARIVIDTRAVGVWV